MKLQQLLRFYLDCIQAEDSKASRKPLSALHHSVISPWDDGETLLSSGAGSIEFETKYASERSLLSRGPALAGEPERLFYGYPLLLFTERRDWYVSPLFTLEVEVLEKDEGNYTVQPVDADDMQLNRQLFARLHVQPEEMASVVQELEAPFESFAARLEAAYQLMACPNPRLDPARLDRWPQPPYSDSTWVNRPVLFKSEQSPYTSHLRRELEQLAADPLLETKARGTALGLFCGAGDGTAARSERGVPLLQVMPLNGSQDAAARSALATGLTVVTGPPGTGKSQVVVDLLASCAAAGKSVLFASKNNKAVDVVRERMRLIMGESQDWVLRLGNRQIMEECRTSMEGRLAAISTLPLEQSPSPSTLQALDERISGIRTQLQRLESLHEELQALDRERRVSESLVRSAWRPECTGLEVASARSCAWIRMKSDCRALSDPQRRSVSLWLRRQVFRRRTVAKLTRAMAQDAVSLPSRVNDDLPLKAVVHPEIFAELAEGFDRLVSLARWRQAAAVFDAKIAELAAQPTSQSLTTQVDELSAHRAELCSAQFRTTWTSRLRTSSAHQRLSAYFGLADRASRSQGGQWAATTHAQWAQQVQTLGADLPVWIVTSLSARRALPLAPAQFDLLIMDEASQCDIPSALPLLFRARRVLIIGDPQQLRHISTLPTDEEMAIAATHGLLNEVSRWSYNQRSLYALSEDITTRDGHPVAFLAEHYRSHPAIIEFSNRSFYQGRLILRTNLPRLKEKLQGEELGVFWHDTPGAVARTSRSAANDAEVAAVVDLLGRWQKAGLLTRDGPSIGIVTPFRLQMERLRAAITGAPWPEGSKQRANVGTAHRFQGDECDIMVFSPVVASGLAERLSQWVATTDQLLNVAITRARGALHVVGDMSACIAAGGKLGDFALSVKQGIEVRPDTQLTETPPEQRVEEMLAEMGLWHANQYQVGGYRLDFLVVSPQGLRYDLEIDGRGHLTDEAVRADERRDIEVKSLGMRIVRIDARLVFSRPSAVREILLRMC